MFEYFTAPAKRALVASQDEAISLGHDFVGTGHILLGILAEGEGVALKVLAVLDVDVAALRSAVLARAARQAS